jgi:hypothetical protein
MLNPADLDPEPRCEQRPQQRHHHAVVEMPIEAELIDRVVAGQPATQKFGNRGDALGQFVGRRCRFAARGGHAAALVDLADDGGDLLGGRAALGL